MRTLENEMYWPPCLLIWSMKEFEGQKESSEGFVAILVYEDPLREKVGKLKKRKKG